MDNITILVADLFVVLTAGLLAGAISKRLEISLLVGYLVVGAIIGEGILGLVTQENRELEYLARAGALLLLFAVGIEFSVEELVRLSRYFLVGGTVQMILVAVPLTVVFQAFGMSWKAAILSGSAGALSSTVLVFKALAEWGQTASPHGRRAIGILLFQDVALVPLVLLIPLLTDTGESPTGTAFSILVAKTLLFVGVVMAARRVIRGWVVPVLAGFRSVELVILFALSLLGGVCLGAFALGMPAAIGALAAGIMLSGNRLSKQIDSVVLPLRESFSVVFFVTLGTLLNPVAFLHEPVLLLLGLIGMLILKSGAAAIALRLVGLRWAAAMGMGLGLAQLGEFSFLVAAEALASGLISNENYNRMLFVGLGTLILTPQLLKMGLRWTGQDDETLDIDIHHQSMHPLKRALVVGVGTIGRQVASHLEIAGVDVRVVDQSPINLHSFAQQGFHATSGDARDPKVLRRAGADQCSLAVITIPNADAAKQIIRNLHALNPRAVILVRSHFQSNVSRLRNAGAHAVISDEAETSSALLRKCGEYLGHVDPNDHPGEAEREGG